MCVWGSIKYTAVMKCHVSKLLLAVLTVRSVCWRATLP